ncbi:MAG: ABC transporter permease [Anaerolineae bacterium]|jgi:ABC-2 type transport system permease protein
MPASIMPDFQRSLSRFVPHAWAMQDLQDALIRGSGLAGVHPEAGVLMALAAVFFAIGAWRFRFEE